MEKTREHRDTGRVTLQEVANFTGVRIIIIFRALRTPEQISDKLRERIEQAVEELDCISNRIASVLASGYSDTVVVLVLSLTGKASSRFMQSSQQALSKNEFQLLLGRHEHNRLREAKILMTLLQSNSAALVIFGSQLADKTHWIFEKTNIPTISVIGPPFSSAQITIETAFFETSYELAEHLLKQDHKDIGFIGAHMDNRLQRRQLNGWHKAVLSHYQDFDLAITMPDATSLQLGRYILSEILLRRPKLDAVTCSHGEIMLGIMSECQRRLLKISENIAVTCLDGLDNCDQTHLTLTSIRTDYKKMRIETGKLLVGLLSSNHGESKEPRTAQFNYQIGLRQSTWA